MKIIKVGKECRITNEDIANHLDRFTAISVVALNDEDGFINVQLSIDNDCQCCEDCGAEFVKNFESETIFVDSIEIYDAGEERPISLPVPDYYKDSDYYDESYFESDSVLAIVRGINSEILAYGYVYNIHNGYYGHYVFIDENGENIYKKII